MRAIVLHEQGAPENLTLEEVPVPEPGPGEILVRTEAIGVSFTEAALRSGAWPFPVPLPATFGFEAAGTVVKAAGPAEHGQRVVEKGQRVVVMSTGLGTYAEYVVTPAAVAAPVPDGMTAQDAVAVAAFGAVALQLLRAARLTGTETVLVESAAGGVGGYLTQLARQYGAARVIGTAGTAAKRDHAKALGADETVDHSVGNWTAGLKNIDVGFDSLAGESTARLADAITPGTGRILLYGLLQGMATITATDLLTRGLTLTGCGGPAWMESVQAAKAEVLKLTADGKLRPQIDSVLSLEQAAQAHRRFDSREPMGKIILTP
jgi:NADPH:quinone reductase-like Zn-dependent oxidoreductase